MSEEFKNLQDRINRMKKRIEKIVSIKGELDALVAEAETDITAMQLQLDALRYEGDSENE